MTAEPESPASGQAEMAASHPSLQAVLDGVRSSAGGRVLTPREIIECAGVDTEVAGMLEVVNRAGEDVAELAAGRRLTAREIVDRAATGVAEVVAVAEVRSVGILT